MKEVNYENVLDSLLQDNIWSINKDPKLNWGNDGDFQTIIDIISDHIPFGIDEDEDYYTHLEDKLINSLINNDKIINVWNDR